MKTVLTIWMILELSTSLFAQSGYKNYTVSAGWSTNNSKFLHLGVEGSSARRLQLGMSLDAIFFSTITSKLSISSDKMLLTGGLFVKARLGNSRNFNHEISAGASIGSDNSNTIWYPYLGLEQVFYCSPRMQLVIGEKCLYIFRVPESNWQPILNIGFRFSY